MFRSSKSDSNLALDAVTSQPLPPLGQEDYNIHAETTTPKAYLVALKGVFEKSTVNKLDEDLVKIAEYLFSDPRKALFDIKDAHLNKAKTDLTAYTSQKVDEADNPKLIEYRSALCQALVATLQSQEQAIDKSIAAEIKAIEGDDTQTAISQTFHTYLREKQDVLTFYLQFSTALYQCASEYYIERWKAAHLDAAQLKKECDAINYIFQDIIQIQADYTITPLKDIREKLFKKRPADVAGLLNTILKRAAGNKLDEQKSLYQTLLTKLNAANTPENNPDGLYFKPLDPAEKKHTVVLHDSVTEMFHRYMATRKSYEQLKAGDIEAISEIHTHVRYRVAEFSAVVAGDAAKDLTIVEHNLQDYRLLLESEQDILENFKSQKQQLDTTRQKLEHTKLPLEKISKLGFSSAVTTALLKTFNEGEFGSACNVLQDRFANLRRQLSTQYNKLHELKLAFQDSETNLAQVDAEDCLHSINYEVKCAATDQEQLQQDIKETQSNLQAASTFLDQVAHTKATIDGAMQHYQDLIDGREDRDFFIDASLGLQPLASAIQSISSLKQRKHYVAMPQELHQHFDNAAQLLQQTQQDFNDILRCHFLLNAILNFNFWHLKKPASVTILTGNQRYRIPRDIFHLLKLAGSPEHQHWATDPEAARLLLAAMRNLAGSQNNRTPVINKLMEIIANPNSPITPPVERRQFAQMFPQPLRLIQHADITRVQETPPFHKRHPVLTKVLIGAGAGLLAFAFLAGVTALILSGIGILPGIIAAVGGASAAWGIAGGSAAASTGIGAGIGAIFGRRQIPANLPAAPINQPLQVRAPAVYIPRENRPPPPAHKPVQVIQVQPASLAASKSALFQPPRGFAEAVVNYIIDTYSGKPDQHQSSPEIRRNLSQLWVDSKYSLDHFIQTIEDKRPATATAIIKQAVRLANDAHPYVIHKFPADSLIRAKYAPKNLAVPRNERSIMNIN